MLRAEGMLVALRAGGTLVMLLTVLTHRAGKTTIVGK